jgi:TnpA family transposase
MKQQWTSQELIDHWALTQNEIVLAQSISKIDHNQLGYALMLKYFQSEGRFPQRKQDIPDQIIIHIARQLRIQESAYVSYNWTGRTQKRHRSHIRSLLGFRTGTAADTNEITEWLSSQLLGENRQFDRLKEVVYERYQDLKIEPPEPKIIDRLIRSAVRTSDEQFYATTMEKLSPVTRKKLDALLNPKTLSDGTTDNTSPLQQLRSDAGACTLDSVLAEIEKLKQIRALDLPPDLFSHASGRVVSWYRQRVAVEDLPEIRRHPEDIRYTLLSAYCYQQEQEITDNLLDLLINLIHRIEKRAERTVDKQILKDVKRIQGKHKLLYEVAQVSIEKPDGTVKEVIYPVAPEQTLRDLVQEFKADGSYEQKVQVFMRGSYSHHYRRMVPLIIKTLTFSSTSTAPKPLLAALELIRKYADKNQSHYPETEDVPLDGIVPAAWLSLVKQGQRVNRINYELCVLKVSREKLRCKEIYVIGANRYRNPDEDLPADFHIKRNEYYAELDLPLSADEFIATQKRQMQEALDLLDRGLSKNKNVEITERNDKPWIKVAKLKPQPEPKNLVVLKAEIGRRWGQLFLLDVFKEAALRTGFPNLFKSPALYETLPRETLQIRLLLCLFALGTNIGLKRIVSGVTEKFRDLLYIRNRYISKDNLRAAIALVANAILRERQIGIWGEATSCAGDSKKFGAYDQNLLTEWHIRYRGPGIMVYWHVEKKALCIYSQIKRCSSSEVASMIQGLLRHCTDMNVERGFVDTHGQSTVGFAFTHLLHMQLMPRFADIAKKKLHRPDVGMTDAYPNLQPILTSPIDWKWVLGNYDGMIKYTTALKKGTAEAEAILSRFTRNGPQHPVYKAAMELGKARQTIFLCNYLNSEELRQEIQEGLNVIENWNGANSFAWYGKGGEIAVNNREDQEIAILALHLLQICMVYINTLLVQKILSEKEWLNKMQPEDFRGLTPLFYGHITPYGEFQLDMNKRINIEGTI